MATSGSLNTSSYQGRYYTLSWTASQSVASNKSTITWTITAKGGSANWYAERTLKAVINGTTVYSKTSRVQRYKGEVASGTIDIAHNSDGSKSFSASLQAAVYYSTVNCTGSKSFTLTQIPRQANITTAPNFNDEGNPAITYSNPAGNAVTTLQACIANTAGNTVYVPYRDISKTGTSYTFSLTETERNALRNACNKANSMSVKFYIKTVIGGNTFYSTSTKTLSIVNANPTISASVKDVEPTTVALTGDNTKLIKYHSEARYYNTVTAKKGATIVSRKVTCGNLTGTAAEGALKGVESGTFVFTATDSRGNTASQTVTLTMINYVKLTCNLDCPAPNALGDMTFTIKGNAFNGSFGESTNYVTVQYRFKVNDGEYGEWSTVGATHSGNTYSATRDLSNLDYRSTYTFQARVTDRFGTVTTGEISVRTPPVFDWGEEDFNFNVPVMMNGQTVLRHNKEANNTVLSASGGFIYIRPQGTDNTTNEIRITPQGDIILGGQSLKALLGIS